jgi:hypothetical protein
MVLAVRDGDPAVVNTLLDLGADVDRLKGDNWSGPERAVFKQSRNDPRLRWPLQSGSGTV